MKFVSNVNKPIEIEVEVNGATQIITFDPRDLKTREHFFQTYEDLKAYKPKDITPVVDENGVSNIELENTKELVRFTEFFKERFDGVFGAGTADFIMNGKCNPGELIRFTCETARFFSASSENLMKRYAEDTAESGVME